MFNPYQEQVEITRSTLHPETSKLSDIMVNVRLNYSLGTVNSNTVNSKFHLIRSYCEYLVKNPIISCLKCTVYSNTVNSKCPLIRSKFNC